MSVDFKTLVTTLLTAVIIATATTFFNLNKSIWENTERFQQLNEFQKGQAVQIDKFDQRLRAIEIRRGRRATEP